jgi:hypothetical protein
MSVGINLLYATTVGLELDIRALLLTYLLQVCCSIAVGRVRQCDCCGITRILPRVFTGECLHLIFP